MLSFFDKHDFFTAIPVDHTPFDTAIVVQTQDGAVFEVGRVLPDDPVRLDVYLNSASFQ